MFQVPLERLLYWRSSRHCCLAALRRPPHCHQEVLDVRRIKACRRSAMLLVSKICDLTTRLRGLGKTYKCAHGLLGKKISNNLPSHLSNCEQLRDPVLSNIVSKSFLEVLPSTPMASILFLPSLLGFAFASPITMPDSSNTTALLAERQIGLGCGDWQLKWRLAGKDGKGDAKTIYYDKQASVSLSSAHILIYVW